MICFPYYLLYFCIICNTKETLTYQRTLKLLCSEYIKSYRMHALVYSSLIMMSFIFSSCLISSLKHMPRQQYHTCQEAVNFLSIKISGTHSLVCSSQIIIVYPRYCLMSSLKHMKRQNNTMCR